MDADVKRKILLIDDDTSLLVTLSDFLNFEGYEVVTADSGEQGLKRLEVFAPDLIILDMSMPGMGGVGFLKEISAADGKPKHPVLVLTARAAMAEFFANVDVDGFVAKPCDPNDLLMEVGRILFLRTGTEGAAAPAAGDSGKRVLIGEDDATVAPALTDFFQTTGFVAESVSKGPDVLEKALTWKPDVIVMKLVFTGMNGDEVAEMLGRMPNTEHIPVLLYDDSGAPAPESDFTEAKSGVKMFIRNNDPSSLVQGVRTILES